jgi:hypothetical protein
VKTGPGNATKSCLPTFRGITDDFVSFLSVSALNCVIMMQFQLLKTPRYKNIQRNAVGLRVWLFGCRKGRYAFFNVLVMEWESEWLI